MQIPIKLWLLILVEKMEQERACNPLTLQVAGRESVWWARSGSVSTNQTILKENSWMLEQFSRRRFPCGACVGSEELWPGNESSRLDGAAGDAARLPLTRSSRREGLAGLAGSVLVGWMVGH